MENVEYVASLIHPSFCNGAYEPIDATNAAGCRHASHPSFSPFPQGLFLRPVPVCSTSVCARGTGLSSRPHHLLLFSSARRFQTCFSRRGTRG